MALVGAGSLRKQILVTSSITSGREGGLMLSYKKTLVLCLVAMALIVSPLSALASNDIEAELNRNKPPPDPALMIVDLIIVRPLGLVATVGGSVFFILSLPFSALGGNADDAWESLVVSPAAFTFTRPLGGFD
jgi:hypothetical protein